MGARIAIVGAGLAGCEVAWQLACRRYHCDLFEMRPLKETPAHKSASPAELVCSNSFKSTSLANAHGLLKAELQAAGSLIIACATEHSLPAGSALAVDRLAFAKAVEAALVSSPYITIHRQEVSSIPELASRYDYVVLATGPLTSANLGESLQAIIGEQSLYFYDAIAPIIYRESINEEIAFKAARYEKGGADYYNCPFRKEEFTAFIAALGSAEVVPLADFEKAAYFEGCLPIEVMAERGAQTLTFGPFKPVGFRDPRTGERPYAVLQLRQENAHDTLYNMVGCQTKLKYAEQARIFRLVPGLEQAEFARFGSLHRNTYINAPQHLTPRLELSCAPGIFLAGQITGVEGYTESTSSGLWCALQIIAQLRGQEGLIPDSRTQIGALIEYVCSAAPPKGNFQPMNGNFGLMRPLETDRPMGKAEKRERMSQLALQTWQDQLAGGDLLADNSALLPGGIPVVDMATPYAASG